MKNSVPLSPLKLPSADSEQGVEKNNPAPGKAPQSPHVSMETSNLRPQTPRAEVEPEDEDEGNSPLTISELAYRFAELYNTFSAARNLKIFPKNLHVIPFCHLGWTITTIFSNSFVALTTLFPTYYAVSSICSRV